MRWFANDFHEWRSHSWNFLVNRFVMRDKISLFTANHTILYFYTQCYTLYGRDESNCRSLISTLSPRTVLSNLALWCHHGITLTCDVTQRGSTGIVTSYSSIVLAGANWHKLILARKYHPWTLISRRQVFTRVAGHNGHKPKRPQTEMAKNQLQNTDSKASCWIDVFFKRL